MDDRAKDLLKYSLEDAKTITKGEDLELQAVTLALFNHRMGKHMFKYQMKKQQEAMGGPPDTDHGYGTQ